MPVDQPSTADPACHSSWQAQLELGFSRAGGRAVLGHSRHTGPLRVQRPFYPEGALAHLYILHPPGGVVGGDQLEISLCVEDGAQVLCTTPGSGKFYLSAGQVARLEQQLRIKRGCSLEWLPQENILFAGARLHSATCIELENDAVFIGWDITCLGRPANAERFEHGSLGSRLTLFHNGEPLLVENQRVLGKQQLDAAAGLRGQPVQGILLAFPCTAEHLDAVRDALARQPAPHWIAATLMEGLLVVRALGGDSETLKQTLIVVWQTLRPGLLARPAVAPRIWAT
ncbi:MAG TPA: urease accessory protein UreD [Gammaproteobacteria bacterium]|nr:urease accessory protein UreD [Gammaproteobacteria bacterium]